MIIVGVVIFFVGVFYITAQGGDIAKNPEGIVISFIGFLLIIIGVVAGIVRGVRRMMRE